MGRILSSRGVTDGHGSLMGCGKEPCRHITFRLECDHCARARKSFQCLNRNLFEYDFIIPFSADGTHVHKQSVSLMERSVENYRET
jgi:hypothetical protein